MLLSSSANLAVDQETTKVSELSDLFELTDAEVISHFAHFHKQFRRQFNADNLVHLSLMAQEIQREKLPNEGVFMAFTDMRIAAQKLRAAFMFFDVDHKPPKELHKLVKKMGSVKDAILAGAEYEKPARKLEKYLRRIESFNFELDFVPTTSRDVKAYFLGLANEAKRLVDFANRDADGNVLLSARKYHDLRKIFRNYGWFVSYMKNEVNVRGLKKFKRSLKGASQLMGDNHDEIEQLSLLGDLNYKNVTMALEPEILEMVDTLYKISRGQDIKFALNKADALPEQSR